MLLKKAAVLAFALSASAAAFAVDPITHTIQMTATVPTSDFYVEPVDPTWIGKTQNLPWNPLNETLGSWQQEFDVKHADGSIHAHLDQSAIMYGGSETFALDVTFNGTALTTTAKEVVTAAQAANNYRTRLSIVPKKPTNGYVPGDYSGTVALIFDAVVTPPPPRQ
jgi:hypothetical protein